MDKREDGPTDGWTYGRTEAITISPHFLNKSVEMFAA